MIGIFAMIVMSAAGCSKNKLDISGIEFDKSAKAYTEKFSVSRIDNQQGSWQNLYAENGEFKDTLLNDDGKKSVHYYFRYENEAKQIVYENIPIGTQEVGKLVEYNDRIVFLNFGFDKENTFLLLTKLKARLGAPTTMINHEIGYDEKAEEVQLIINNLSKSEFSVVDKALGKMLIFPIHYIWVKGEIIYKYTLVPGNKFYGSDLTVISKQALRDHLIFGYHNVKKDPILSQYVN